MTTVIAQEIPHLVHFHANTRAVTLVSSTPSICPHSGRLFLRRASVPGHRVRPSGTVIAVLAGSQNGHRQPIE
ncbi:MAG TPA: hypothetical protein VFN75_09990 [Pseudonocardiaceae bacterium]|nr:hypothetical protein [Pseudonocardiaceae bacterium]